MRITSTTPQLRVADLERALAFYLETLGFILDFRFQDFYAGVRCAGGMLHLKRVDTPDPSVEFVRAGDHLHLYFRVTDLDAAFLEISGKAELVYPIETKPWGDREFTIRDPDGHTLYFAQAPEPAAP